MYQHVSLESTAQLSSSTPPVLENQPASLDFDQVTHFLALLDPEADAFVFSAHDDDKERARTLKAAAAGGATKPSAFESRCAPIREFLPASVDDRASSSRVGHHRLGTGNGR